jgi:hypothetical protein
LRRLDSLATAMVMALISAAAAAKQATRCSPLPAVVPATRWLRWVERSLTLLALPAHAAAAG